MLDAQDIGDVPSCGEGFSKTGKKLVVWTDACNQGPRRVPDRTIGHIKVQKEQHGPDEATWELEDDM